MAEFSKKKQYTAESLVVLDGLEPVRQRPGMYIGSTDSKGLHHLIWEIVDNSVDEILEGYGTQIKITIHKDESISVLDEGRGIPTDIHPEKKISGVELVFTSLHAGGKFGDNNYSASGGLHGVGASVTNALSTYCDVTVFRNNEIFNIRFEDGGKVVKPLSVIGTTKKHGTLVTFKPDPTIFQETTIFDWKTLCSRMQQSAYLLKNVRFILEDERTNSKIEYCYTNGLKDYVDFLNQDKKHLSEVIIIEQNDEYFGTEIALQFCIDDYNEALFSYANNVRTIDGGTHETGFRNGLYKAINEYAEQNSMIKAGKKIDIQDIKEGMTAIISLKLYKNKIQFEGQTKGRLINSEVIKYMSDLVYTKMSYYLNEHKEFAVSLIRKCIDAENARTAARKARDDYRSPKKSKNIIFLSDKLTPAQSKDYKNNELFIVEGESAGGTARKGRDRHHQAILPLRGKPLNTDSLTLEKVIKNEEFATIINTIGAGVGNNFNVDNSKYGKIIIMTDADTDGAHIQTLLLTFFYRYMRTLITSGKLFVAIPPLYRVSKEVNKKITFKYAWNNQDLEEAKKYVGSGYRITRYKGLGEMNESQLWDTTMNPSERQLLQVVIEDALEAEKRVTILMGKDASIRRQWVEENVDFNEVDNFLEEVK